MQMSQDAAIHDKIQTETANMAKSTTNIYIFNYPGALPSAVYGIVDFFEMANSISEQEKFPMRFVTSLLCPEKILQHGGSGAANDNSPSVIILPPAKDTGYIVSFEQDVKKWLIQHYKNGSLICSACFGTFLLAETGLLDYQEATTHWALADEFVVAYPEVKLNVNRILIREGNIITAGGMMAWMDLVIELIARLSHPRLTRLLAKRLVIDIGCREQQCYQSFHPQMNHGDAVILKIQHHLQSHFDKALDIKCLADIACMSQRTFLRRFPKATGFKPAKYLQHLRVQKACDLLEATQRSIDEIANKVGYNDSCTFRKNFKSIIGLSPSNYRNKFNIAKAL